MKRQLLIIGLLIVFAGGSWWLASLIEPEREEVAEEKVEGPLYFSYGYTKIEMDKQGRPKNKLTAEKMTHYGEDESTLLEKPVLMSYKRDAPPWVVKSDKGRVSKDGEEILLVGKVFIDRDRAPGVRQVHVKTKNLRVKPEKDYAETDEWIEVVSPPDRLEAVGAQLYFSDPIKLNLLSNVKGRYEPK